MNFNYPNEEHAGFFYPCHFRFAGWIVEASSNLHYEGKKKIKILKLLEYEKYEGGPFSSPYCQILSIAKLTSGLGLYMSMMLKQLALFRQPALKKPEISFVSRYGPSIKHFFVN